MRREEKKRRGEDLKDASCHGFSIQYCIDFDKMHIFVT